MAAQGSNTPDDKSKCQQITGQNVSAYVQLLNKLINSFDFASLHVQI